MQVCGLWHAAALDPRDEAKIDKALGNSYAVAAAFAPRGAMLDRNACSFSYRTARAPLNPSDQLMIGFARSVSGAGGNFFEQ